MDFIVPTPEPVPWPEMSDRERYKFFLASELKAAQADPLRSFKAALDQSRAPKQPSRDSIGESSLIKEIGHPAGLEGGGGSAVGYAPGSAV